MPNGYVGNSKGKNHNKQEMAELYDASAAVER